MKIFSTGRSMKKSEVLIFAFPRTGSTTLAESLGMFRRVEKLLEPFNETDGYTAGREPVADREGLFRILDEISGNGINVVKHLNIQLTRELNCQLLEYGFRHILYLWRRNALKRVVSNEISFQAKEWRRDREKILNTDYQPLDIEKLRGNINWYKAEVKFYRDYLESRTLPYKEIVMEDFYQKSMEEKEQFIVSLARLYFPLKGLSYNRKGLIEILSPEVSRLNSRDTYRMVPNIEEVERELGSEENGYLFQ
jgi:hypothetical protein